MTISSSNGTGDLVGGRPCVALRTPDQLCNCLGPILRPARTQGIELLIGGIQHHPRLLCSSRQHRVLHHLITYNQLDSGAITARPVENPLARPIRSLLLSRRACTARWSQIIHRYPPFLRESLRLCALSKSPANEP